jgi:hypothetical protein
MPAGRDRLGVPLSGWEVPLSGWGFPRIRLGFPAYSAGVAGLSGWGVSAGGVF